FPVICGTSAGAVNAGALAVHADDFGAAVESLLQVWRNFEPHHVYRSDFPGVAANSARWFAGFLFGAFLKNRKISLLEKRPLEPQLTKTLNFSRLSCILSAGALDAFANTCSGYISGQSCIFFEGGEAFEDWKRSQRIGIMTRIQVSHFMAFS